MISAIRQIYPLEQLAHRHSDLGLNRAAEEDSRHG